MASPAEPGAEPEEAGQDQAGAGDDAGSAAVADQIFGVQQPDDQGEAGGIEDDAAAGDGGEEAEGAPPQGITRSGTQGPGARSMKGTPKPPEAAAGPSKPEAQASMRGRPGEAEHRVLQAGPSGIPQPGASSSVASHADATSSPSRIPGMSPPGAHVGRISGRRGLGAVPRGQGVNVSSPTREERMQRKQWAEIQRRRKMEMAQRMQRTEAQLQAEAQERMEARRKAVRERIEREKQAQRALAEERKEKLAGLDRPPEPSKRRNPSPRPLYIRLQEEFEQRQAAEEEEVRKKLQLQAAMKLAPVHSLVSGQVVVKPLPGEQRPKDPSPPRWVPGYKGLPAGAMSPRGTFDPLLYDLPPGAGMPQYTADNGMVLYSMTGMGGGGEGGAHMHGGGRNAGMSLAKGRGSMGRFGHKMVDRACSPFEVDPRTHQVVAPPQDQFWPSRAARAQAQLEALQQREEQEQPQEEGEAAGHAEGGEEGGDGAQPYAREGEEGEYEGGEEAGAYDGSQGGDGGGWNPAPGDGDGGEFGGDASGGYPQDSEGGGGYEEGGQGSGEQGQ